MNKVVEYVIAAKDRTAGAVKSALGRLRAFAASAVANLANVRAGFDMALGVARRFAGLFAGAIREAFRFEKATSDFKVLLGSIDAAKEHIADLQRFAARTPLTFGDLSKASKLLLSFGASVEDVMPSLKVLGDIAMGDAQKFQGLALVFAQVKSAGRLMGQDLLQMINQGFNPLTVISQQTGKSMAELKDMMADGAISFEMVAEAMRVATSDGGLFANAMDEAAKTGEGLVSTLSDNWDAAVREFGNAFTDAAKGGIQMMIDKLTELVENGTVEDWANGIATKVSQVADTFGLLGKAVSAVWKHFGLSDMWHGANSVVQGVASAVGTAIGGGSWSDISDSYSQAAVEELAKGHYTRKLMENGVVDDKYVRMELDALHAEEEGKAARRGRRGASAPSKAASPPARARAEDEARQGRSLAQMMAEQEKKAAEERRRKEEEAAKKAAERKAAEDERLRQKEEQERARLEQKIHAERMRLLEQELSLRKRDEDDAAAALSAAQADEAQAWGWYRDRDSWKAQLAEERANAAAQKQFEKDFERLKFRRDWRTSTSLSDDEEVVRRVGLARERREAAEEYARQTAEATQRAADALDAINGTLNEGSAE